MGIYIKGMKMPKSCEQCWFFGSDSAEIGYCYLLKGKLPMPDGMPQDCPLIEIPSHGGLIDRDTLIADLKRQCEEVFKTDAVSPDDFWITRNQAYNERLWTTWCESLFDYLKAAPTIITADNSTHSTCWNALGMEGE